MNKLIHPQMSKPDIWTIAGSDCTGGAGIQADTKTFHGLGTPVATIITAVTAQNHLGVQAINAVSNDCLESQFNALMAISKPRFIKIGMLANTKQVNCISQWLASLKNENPALVVVYDPVAIASNGGALTESCILTAVKEKLISFVDYITPNLAEAEILTALTVSDWDSVLQASSRLRAMGANNAIITGGHYEQSEHCVDVLDLHTDEQFWLSHKKINTNNTHGTGCTFASALTAFLANNYHPRDAFTLANAFVHESIAQSSQPNNYASVVQGLFPSNAAHFADVLVSNSTNAKHLNWQHGDIDYVSGFKPIAFDILGLYPVVDSCHWIEKLLRAGVKTIQLRVKHLSGDDLSQEIESAVALGRKYQGQVFINDYWQLAIKHKAYGIHLGQEDLAGADLAQIQQQGLRLGISTHGHYEYLKVSQLSPSYIAIGAIFPTKTKDMTGQIQGLESLAQIVQLNNQKAKIPLTAIGGITVKRADQIIATGIDSFAVVTAITQAEDPISVTKELLSMLPVPQQRENID